MTAHPVWGALPLSSLSLATLAQENTSGVNWVASLHYSREALVKYRTLKKKITGKCNIPQKKHMPRSCP